jgi:hypothetical protein
LGGVPTLLPDVPVCAIFLALFIGAAAGHMGLFQANKKRGRKFVLNAATFGRLHIDALAIYKFAKRDIAGVHLR